MTIVRARYWNTSQAAHHYLRTFAPTASHPERRLWSTDGAPRSLAAATALIDRAPSPRLFYGFLLSPDPTTEDRPRDLDLQELTDQTLRALGHRLGRPLPWVAAEDHEHGRGRHVHVLAIRPRRLGLPDLAVLSETATVVTCEQRRYRDARDSGSHVPVSIEQLLEDLRA